MLHLSQETDFPNRAKSSKPQNKKTWHQNIEENVQRIQRNSNANENLWRGENCLNK